jgi:hypothetical protein
VASPPAAASTRVLLTDETPTTNVEVSRARASASRSGPGTE